MDKQCRRNTDSKNWNAVGIIGGAQHKPSMCEMASMRNASMALQFTRPHLTVDDGGVLGLKTPPSFLTRLPLRGQDQAPRYV